MRDVNACGRGKMSEQVRAGEISRDRITAVDRVSTPVTVIPRPMDGSPCLRDAARFDTRSVEPAAGFVLESAPPISGRNGERGNAYSFSRRFILLYECPVEMFWIFREAGEEETASGRIRRDRCYGISIGLAYTSQLSTTHSCQTTKEASPRISTRGWMEYDGVKLSHTGSSQFFPPSGLVRE